MKPICVVGGGGYVGLGYAVALANLGHQVVGLDIDATRVERLNRGDSPIYEAGLRRCSPQSMRAASASQRITPTAYRERHRVSLRARRHCRRRGRSRQVRAAAASIGTHLQPATSTIIVNKSTMPVGTAELVSGIVAEHAPGRQLRSRQQSRVPTRGRCCRHPSPRPRCARR